MRRVDGSFVPIVKINGCVFYGSVALFVIKCYISDFLAAFCAGFKLIEGIGFYLRALLYRAVLVNSVSPVCNSLQNPLIAFYIFCPLPAFEDVNGGSRYGLAVSQVGYSVILHLLALEAELCVIERLGCLHACLELFLGYNTVPVRIKIPVIRNCARHALAVVSVFRPLAVLVKIHGRSHHDITFAVKDHVISYLFACVSSD